MCLHAQEVGRGAPTLQPGHTLRGAACSRKGEGEQVKEEQAKQGELVKEECKEEQAKGFTSGPASKGERNTCVHPGASCLCGDHAQ
eukprot:639517-Pelagomonas_calceolata.AAC.1